MSLPRGQGSECIRGCERPVAKAGSVCSTCLDWDAYELSCAALRVEEAAALRQYIERRRMARWQRDFDEGRPESPTWIRLHRKACARFTRRWGTYLTKARADPSHS